MAVIAVATTHSASELSDADADADAVTRALIDIRVEEVRAGAKRSGKPRLLLVVEN